MKNVPKREASRPSHLRSENIFRSSQIHHQARQIKTARRNLPLELQKSRDSFDLYTPQNYGSSYFKPEPQIQFAHRQTPGGFNSFALNSRYTLPSNQMNSYLPSNYYSSYMNTYYPSTSLISSKLGNIPKVNLSPPKTLPHLHHDRPSVKPVTVRIAPLPQSKNFTQNALAKIAQPTNQAFTFAPNLAPPEIQRVVQGLKEKRKRPLREEVEQLDSKLSKRTKRNEPHLTPSFTKILPNGLHPTQQMKQASKRSATDTDLSSSSVKRYKNNEILSSYCSLGAFKSPITSKESKSIELNKKSDKTDALNKTNELSSEMIVNQDSIIHSPVFTSTPTKDDKTNNQKEFLSLEKKSDKTSGIYRLPEHIHTMEEHERDANKSKKRFATFLKVIEETTSPPKQDTNLSQPLPSIAPITTVSSISNIIPTQIIVSNESPKPSSGAITTVTTSLPSKPISSPVESGKTPASSSSLIFPQTLLTSGNKSEFTLNAVTTLSSKTTESVMPINSLLHTRSQQLVNSENNKPDLNAQVSTSSGLPSIPRFVAPKPTDIGQSDNTIFKTPTTTAVVTSSSQDISNTFKFNAAQSKTAQSLFTFGASSQLPSSSLFGTTISTTSSSYALTSSTSSSNKLLQSPPNVFQTNQSQGSPDGMSIESSNLGIPSSQQPSNVAPSLFGAPTTVSSTSQFNFSSPTSPNMNFNFGKFLI